jgi:uncharacterized membrane protein YdfJ with MMPL/SSD domain
MSKMQLGILVVLGIIGTGVLIQNAAELGFVPFMIALFAAMAFWGGPK